MPIQVGTSSRNSWVLQAFEKDPGEKLVHQWILPTFTDDDLRQLANVSADRHVYGGYRVTQAMVPILRQHIDVTIDLNRYDYFLELQAA